MKKDPCAKNDTKRRNSETLTSKWGILRRAFKINVLKLHITHRPVLKIQEINPDGYLPCTSPTLSLKLSSKKVNLRINWDSQKCQKLVNTMQKVAEEEAATKGVLNPIKGKDISSTQQCLSLPNHPPWIDYITDPN